MRLFVRPALLLAVALCPTACHEKPHDKAVASAATPAPEKPAASARASASASNSASPASAASVAGSVAAPGSAAPAHGAAVAEKHSAAGAAKPPEGASPPPEVKLLSAGAAPRRKLRYHFKKGQVEKFKLTTSTSMTVSLAGRAMPAPAIPSLEMLAQVKVVSVLPDGTARRELAINKVQLTDAAKVPSAVRHSVEDSLSEMAKLKGSDEIDSLGRMHWSKLDTSALDDGQVKQMMQAMASAFGEVSAPFPPQPLGKGARWQVSTHVKQMGVTMKQVATYTLEKLDGDRGTTAIKLEQSAPGSTIQLPGVPLDVHPDLLGMKGSGSGQIQFDLGYSLPTGHITSQSSVKVRTKVAGQVHDTQMDMSLTETFTRM